MASWRGPQLLLLPITQQWIFIDLEIFQKGAFSLHVSASVANSREVPTPGDVSSLHPESLPGVPELGGRAIQGESTDMDIASLRVKLVEAKRRRCHARRCWNYRLGMGRRSSDCSGEAVRALHPCCAGSAVRFAFMRAYCPECLHYVSFGCFATSLLGSAPCVDFFVFFCSFLFLCSIARIRELLRWVPTLTVPTTFPHGRLSTLSTVQVQIGAKHSSWKFFQNFQNASFSTFQGFWS